MKKLGIFIYTLGVISLCLLSPWADSEPPAKLNLANYDNAKAQGLAIAKAADWHNIGFGDSEVGLIMTLINKRGQQSVRELRIKTLEVPEDGDKSLLIFDSPADQKGTALLTISHKVESDDQMLYLPALKRVKKIASRNKSGPFVGSEFAFEDLSSQEVEKYDYEYLREEQLDGEDCFVIVRIPKDEYSGYTKQIAWLDQSLLRLQKIEFYDRKSSHLKTLRFSKYKVYSGYWRAGEAFMDNHQNGKATRLQWSDYQFKVGLNDSDFTKNSLKRAR